MIDLVGTGFVYIIILFAILFFLYLVPLKLWVEALSSGAYVGLFRLIGMRLRGMNPVFVVRPYISAVKANLHEFELDSLEAHYLAIGTKDHRVGLRLNNVVLALISASRAKLNLTTEQAMSIDLAGRDILKAINTSVVPKIIETPRVAAVAKDGIQVIAIAKITVRTNLDRLVGGAGEETIIARVGEGIVSTIGSSTSHKSVLENPDIISQTVLKKGLDSGSAFEILSIDIADVDIGKNIGAELQTDQAEADKKIAQAKAEERRAMAIASEQEMRAKVQEMNSKLVLAESQIPQAIANAFEKGKLGVMDYYRLENIKSDTAMRNSISTEEQRDELK